MMHICCNYEESILGWSIHNWHLSSFQKYTRHQPTFTKFITRIICKEIYSLYFTRFSVCIYSTGVYRKYIINPLWIYTQFSTLLEWTHDCLQILLFLSPFVEYLRFMYNLYMYNIYPSIVAEFIPSNSYV